jgi:PAS domain S-box-containing protein
VKLGDQTELKPDVGLFNTVFEQDAMGMALRAIDPRDSRWLRVNQKFCDMLGYTREELLQLTSVDISLPDERGLAIEYNEQLLRGELSSYSREKCYLRKDGTVIWTNIWLSAVLGPDGNPTKIISVIHDITQQKLAEKALLEANDLLEQRVEERTAELEQKNTELEQFAYTVSHDLKSPLVTVSGFVGLLGKDLQAGDDESVAKDMQHIVSAISQMGRSLDDLLELSRIGRIVNKSQPISLSQLSDEVTAILQGLLTDSEAEIEIAPDMPVVLGDKHRIRDVMQNLLENAIKFCGKNNTPRISVDAEIQGNRVQCRVKDNGIGIDPHYHDMVFGLFDRLDPDIYGSGVGLALVKRIIEVHNGKVWIESEGIGQGTQVYFTLPAASVEMR